MATYVPMILFKSYACIPDNLCVADIMFSTLRERPSRVSSLGTLDECMTVHIYRQKCLKHYLRWKFKTDDLERLDKLTMKLKCKPLTDIERCFDVLHNHGKMPSETIFEHQCLVNCSENELRIIFRKISTICGVPIVELLGNLPALHKMKYVNVACIKTHLEAHDVTGEQMKSFPEVLLLEREDFLKAWTLVVEKPELRLLLKHPNILRIFSSPKHFQIRLEYLEYLNVQNVTTNILASQTDNFERIMKVGAFRKLLPETCLTLCNDLEINHLHMQKLLRTHPRSRYLNLYNTYITLNYLQTKFSNSEIVQSLHTILYPKDKVEKVLEKLLHDNALTDASNRYTAAQLLALCVYEIEKEHHFTGDGVWDYEDKRKAPELSEKHSDGTGDRVK